MYMQAVACCTVNSPLGFIRSNLRVMKSNNSWLFCPLANLRTTLDILLAAWSHPCMSTTIDSMPHLSRKRNIVVLLTILLTIPFRPFILCSTWIHDEQMFACATMTLKQFTKVCTRLQGQVAATKAQEQTKLHKINQIIMHNFQYQI